jgi:uncharacterized protein YggU (UPF0235/DUF167 family)
MIQLIPHPEGTLLPVRAQPGASSSGLRGEHNGMLKVAVTQIAEKGKANKSLVEVLAKELGLKRSQFTLASGDTQREKLFLVRGVEQSDLAARIAAALTSDL